MNNKEFIAEMAKRNGLKATEAQYIMDTLLATMGDSFKEGDTVQLPNFGVFEVRKKLERIINNPATGQRMLVPPKMSLVFKPNPMVKDKIRKGGDING